MNLSRRAFEKLVWAALEEIPAQFRSRMDNIAFTLEERPTPAQRRQFGLGPDDYLLGLYQGIPNTHRGADYGNVLPDKIILFQEPLTRLYPDLPALKREIRKTVWHEVGHYFGLSDAQLRRLENSGREQPAHRKAAKDAKEGA